MLGVRSSVGLRKLRQKNVQEFLRHSASRRYHRCAADHAEFAANMPTVSRRLNVGGYVLLSVRG